MSSKEDPKQSADSQLKALVEDAGQDEVTRAKHRKLSLDEAHDTLNELVKAAGGVPSLETDSPEERCSTKNAMNALFVGRPSHDTAHPQLLVGLEDDGGVENEEEQTEGDSNPKPELAGAQSADKSATPVRKLDDGIDFWQELETIDVDDSESD